MSDNEKEKEQEEKEVGKEEQVERFVTFESMEVRGCKVGPTQKARADLLKK